MPEWIPGFEGRYTISESGEVTSFVQREPRVLRGKLGTDGYPRLCLSRGGGDRARWMLRHRLVLLTYAGQPPEGHEGRHLDGNPLNCHISNLEWSDHRTNVLDKRQHKTDHNATKTHCAKGHEYTAENTAYWGGNMTVRRCRTCQRRHRKEWGIRRAMKAANVSY